MGAVAPTNFIDLFLAPGSQNAFAKKDTEEIAIMETEAAQISVEAQKQAMRKGFVLE